MDLLWIEDFIVLARVRNFSRAAKERNVTQSSFSRRIRALEEWLGVALVERAVPVALTADGQMFLETAEPIARKLHNVRSALRAKGLGEEKAIIFALPHTASVSVLPRLMGELEKAGLSRLPVRVKTDDFEPLLRLFTAGECHFLGAYEHRELSLAEALRASESMLVGHESLIPVSAPTGDGRPRFSLPGSPRAPVPALMLSEITFLGRALAHEIHSRFPRCSLKLAAEHSLALALKPLAENSGGVAWLPESLVLQELTHGTLVRAGGEEWTVRLDLRFFRADEPRSPLADTVWTALRAITGTAP